MAKEVVAIRQKQLAKVLSSASERQRLTFQYHNSYMLPGTLGDGPQVAEVVLRQKGVVLDSILEDRAFASSNPRHPLLKELREVKHALMQSYLEAPRDLGLPRKVEELFVAQQALQWGLTTQALQDLSEELETKLAREAGGLGHPRRALTVRVSDVQSVLGTDEALIELLSYPQY